uniref:Putative chemosensory protein 10 n=1 Tax=Corcyra cephalonica TaxID=139036 RepID=A0A8K1P7T0_CORCP|nr:putative chemosensory protein 10 [Corcyra cephalonica]
MKTFILLCLVGVIAMVVARPRETYTDRFDNINLDEILENRRLLVPYLKCMLDQGKCSADGKELKLHIREAMSENCGKCTEKQKNGTIRVLKHIINKERDYWNQLKAKYDPEDNYSSRYEKEYLVA